MASPFEQLLSDGEAAGALLACMYAEEMAPLRPVSPLVRDCLDMHTDGKVFPLLRQQHRVDGRAGQCMWHLKHQTRVEVRTQNDMTRLDAATAMHTLCFQSGSQSVWNEVAIPHTAWMARVRELDVPFGGLTAAHLAALPNLCTLKLTRLDGDMPSLDGCTALRNLHVCARQLTHAPPTWVTNVTLWIDRFMLQDVMKRAMNAVWRVPSVFIAQPNSIEVDASSLIHAREFTLKKSTLSYPSISCQLPPNLERVALRASYLGDQPIALLSHRVIDDKTLQAMRRIPHVTLENVVLPPTWVDALKHTRTLSLVGCRFMEMPVASEWAEFTALQTLDLHVRSLYHMECVVGLEALARLPRGTRLRLSAAFTFDMPDDLHWKRVRDDASAALFELGVSAIPI